MIALAWGKNFWYTLAALLLVLVLLVPVLAACDDDDDDETTTVTVTTTTTTTPSAATTQPSAPPTTGQTSTPTVAPPVAPPVSLKGKTVAHSCMSFSIGWFLLVEEGIKSVLDPLGITLLEYDANLDPAKQVSDIENAVARKVDALIVNPVVESALVDVCEQARDAGIPVVGHTTAQHLLLDGNGAHSPEWMGWITGTLMGQYLRDNFEGEVEYGVLWAPAVFDSVVQQSGKDLAINYYAPNAKKVAAADSLIQDTGYSYTEDMLIAHPNIKSLTCQTDDAGWGQLGAVESMGRTDVSIFVCGGDIISYEYLQEGTAIKGVNVADTFQLGVETGNMVVSLLRGEDFYPYYSMDEGVATSDNIDYKIALYNNHVKGMPLPAAPRAGMVKKMGYSLPTSRDEFWTNIGMGITNELTDNYPGVTLEVADAGGSSAKQVSDIRQMISDGCETIIVAPVDAGALADVINEAKAAGVYTVGFNMTPPFMEIVEDPHLTGVVQLETDVVFMPDTRWMGDIYGQLVGRYISDNMRDRGNIAIIEDPGDIGTHDIMLAIKRDAPVYASHPQFVAEASATDEASAKAAMSQILTTNPDVEIVTTSSEEIAYGVLDSLSMAGRTDIIVWTIGDNTRTLELIKTGDIYCSIPLNSTNTGRIAASKAVQLAEGNPVELGAGIAFSVITSENVGWHLSIRQEEIAKAQ